MPRLMTLPELIECLRISESTIRRMVRRGELPAIRVGNQLRFEMNAVLRSFPDARTGDVAHA